MKEGRIEIFGPIGTFNFRGTEVNGVMLADVMDKVLRQPADMDYLIVDMESLGGSKAEGKKIATYFQDVKRKGITLEMNQVGPIGSVSTKLFLEGDVRTALDDGSNNWFIHNPWKATEGDAAAHMESAAVLMAAEEELLQEYATKTKLTLEQLKPLMDASAKFNGMQAESFGFATRTVKALNIAAYISMEKDTRTMGQKLDELIANIKKGINPEPDKVLVLKVTEGTSLAVTAKDETKLQDLEIFEADAAGLATAIKAKDGLHNLADGRKITVLGGKITLVEEKAASTDPVLEAKFNELVELLAKSQKPAVGLTQADLDNAILALKAEIKTGHKPGVTGGKNFQIPQTTEADVLEWDRSFAAGEHKKMRNEEPERWTKLYYAKFKAFPTNV